MQKKIPDTDWVLTGIIVDNYHIFTNDPIYKILWSPNSKFPVSSDELYETFESVKRANIAVIRNEKDIPDDFLPSI